MKFPGKLVLLVALVAGCGGGGEGGGGSAPMSVTPPPPVPVTVAKRALAALASAAGYDKLAATSAVWTATPSLATSPVTADPATTNTLTVYLLGVGEVTSDLPGINCGQACKTSLPKTSTVTLTAAAPTGYSFTGWQGDCAGNTPTCKLSMSSPHIVTGTFTSVPTLDGRMDCIFNWAEKTFATDYFPPAKSEVRNGYYTRYYSGPKTYLALYSTNSHVYFVDAAGYMYDYGPIVNFLQPSGC